MKTFYVSLVGDLMGAFLAYEADSEESVRNHLANHYLVGSVWKLPWCSVYGSLESLGCDNPIIIPVHGHLMEIQRYGGH